MHRRIASGLAALSLLAAVPAGSAAAAAPSDTLHAACTSARIQGDRRCIAAGQFCRHTRRANRDYHRYGLHCGKRDRRGNYHLIYR